MGRRLPAILLALATLLFLAGCTTIRPVLLPPQSLSTVQTFSHADLDRVLQRYVDDQGRVDYVALKNDAHDLERYYLLLATYSPDSHPHLFPSEQDKLAYWINAYNAAVIKTVLTHYPISSVADVERPFPFFFLPRISGFFLFQRVAFGEQTTNLYFLLEGVIRKRFAEPRVHFALNCAARSCPRLPRRAFTAERLDEELDREARNFLAEERNLKIDHGEQAVFLSSIFKWYEEDFVAWYRTQFPDQEATLLNYASLYVSPETAEALRRAASYEVRFVPYEWRLNDQRGPA